MMTLNMFWITCNIHPAKKFILSLDFAFRPKNASQEREERNRHGRGRHPRVHHQPPQEASRDRIQVPRSPRRQGMNCYMDGAQLARVGGYPAPIREFIFLQKYLPRGRRMCPDLVAGCILSLGQGSGGQSELSSPQRLLTQSICDVGGLEATHLICQRLASSPGLHNTFRLGYLKCLGCPAKTHNHDVEESMSVSFTDILTYSSILF